MKDHREQKDKEVSKGYVSIRGACRQQIIKKKELESRFLDTRLSTMEVMYVVLKAAVEATIAFEVVEGDMYGEITASPTCFQGNSMVLYDSVGDVISGEGKTSYPTFEIHCSCLSEGYTVSDYCCPDW
ncbi:hypothetical protein ACP70R_031734 [Stipagrostis hirtigluma subsp. patula]